MWSSDRVIEPHTAKHAPTTRRCRRAFQVATATLTAGLLGLYALEIGFRYWRTGNFRTPPVWWVRDTELVYRLNPLATDTPGPLRARDAALAWDTDDETRHIICLGGDVTYGTNVDAQQAWPHVAGIYLRHAGARAQVLNVGTPGHGIRQMLRRFERDLNSLTPDVVIIDPGWDGMGAGFEPHRVLPFPLAAKEDGVARRTTEALYSRSGLLQLFLDRAHCRPPAMPQKSAPAHEYARGRETSHSDLETLFHAVQQAGGIPLAVLPPSLLHDNMSPGEIHEYRMALEGENDLLEEMKTIHCVREGIRSITVRAGVDTVDAQALFSSYRGPARLRVFADLLLPSVMGHRLLGDALGARVEALLAE